MGFILKGIFGLALAFLGYLFYAKLCKVPEVPHFPEDTWWGKSEPVKEDTSIKPFKINVSKEILDDLKHRLDIALPMQPPLNGVGQHYGMNSNLLQKIVNHWKNKYNWSERQKFLNQYPQYTTQIQGLDIHFLHVKPKVDKASNVKVLPLMLLHGWPGSVREFYEVIPLLTKPQKGRNVVFEVIIPSLPGYGFSEATNKPGMNAARMAQIFKKLMDRLGHKKFYVQGGDWGSSVATYLTILYPASLFGTHLNFCLCLSNMCSLKLWLLGSTFPSLIATEEEIPLFTPVGEKWFTDKMLESGYLHIQATKPDTVGTALRESPVGLAAYIIEKFTTWTNPEWKDLEDGGLTRKFTYDQLLDNVMIYWVTRSITTSQRLYSEQFNHKFRALGFDNIPTPAEVPIGCANFKHEIVQQPESLLRLKYLNLQHTNSYNDGGHFAAFELPDMFSNDIYEFVEKINDK
ncbi:unnamed protein product [Ceutorhynchus assimilis]|uniref:Epoxide hydrolase n=1 Tax=Ceutorhynchus assimilis TaxID=467358 RepID=A0A9N9MTT2_9CUCU|nr:unnamed protein product [Ceutorhynchus assimilis]